ncbi:hypothetical protein [Histophilus somni]|uniref:hypothetical protein n=1 Tax=Histophilus somni TaxID=731 RepID=UPI00201F06E9|nr:hypothetical protein [Histophilus somni]
MSLPLADAIHIFHYQHKGDNSCWSFLLKEKNLCYDFSEKLPLLWKINVHLVGWLVGWLVG